MEYLISELLIKNYQKAGSWLSIQNTIEAVNSPNRGRPNKKSASKSKTRRSLSNTIHRRKLRDLAEGKDTVSVSLHELKLLDAYFTRNGGTGLSDKPILGRTQNLFQEIAESEKVTFFIGARYVEALGGIESIALWDISALNLIRDRISSEVASETIDVASRNLTRPVSMIEWRELREQATGNTIVSIGSPIACASSEYLLSQMFQLTAYKAQDYYPPVCFIHDEQDYDSAFISNEEVPKGDPNSRLIIDGEVLRSDDPNTEYAVVVCQRTGPSNTVFVVCGHSGPGTKAAAQSLASGEVNYSMPAYIQGKHHQPVTVVIISTNISSVDTDRRIDRRSVAESHVERIMLFKYSSKRWTQDPDHLSVG